MISERKREANRRNARRSTGPKDTRRTRLNAQTHGLQSKEATIMNGAAKADQRELDSLREALREDPEGTMKEVLMDRIAFCAWFQRRAQRALMGVIIRAAGSTVASDRPSAARRCDLLLKAEEMSSVPSRNGSLAELSKTTWGLAHVQDTLEMIRCFIEEAGVLTRGQLTDLTNIYGRRGGRLGLTIAFLSHTAIDDPKAEDEEELDTGRAESPPDGPAKSELASLDAELERIKEEAALAADRERFRRETAALARQLPRGKTLENILRYAKTNNREMDRAWKELRELEAAPRVRSDNGM